MIMAFFETVYILLLTLSLQPDFVKTQCDPGILWVRLAGSPLSTEGRLEVLYNGEWGTVCDDSFDDSDAAVACYMLGFGRAGRNLYNRYGSGVGTIWLDDVGCTGTENSIDVCYHLPWGSHNCVHGEDVSIACPGVASTAAAAVSPVVPPTAIGAVAAAADTEYYVRLSGSSVADEGRLEVFYNGTWGTVCDDGFDDNDAAVVCYMLGYGRQGRVAFNRYGPGSGNIWLDDLACGGTENDLDSCSHAPWGANDCEHNEDVSVTCQTTITNFRLAGSLSPREGRLEVFYRGQWGTACSSYVSDNVAAVACSMLGFGRAGRALNYKYGFGTGPIWLGYIWCSGSEQSIDACSHSQWGEYDYCSGHYSDVSIACVNGPASVRLSGSSTPGEGRLEVSYNGQWGTVCDDGFDDNDAAVACYMLGHGRAGKMLYNKYGSGAGPIWLDNMDCSGSESSVENCYQTFWGVHDCTHSEDVSIACPGSYASTTASPSCNQASSDSCSVLWANVTSGALNTFNQFTQRTLSEQSRTLICGSWIKFKACLNNTGCTLDNVRVTGYTSDQLNFVFSAYDNMCQLSSSDYVPCFNSSLAGFQRCSDLTTAKTNYPFYLPFYCRVGNEQLVCKVEALKSGCTGTTANSIAAVLAAILKLSQYNCGYDLNYLSTNVTRKASCDSDAFFYCSSQSSAIRSTSIQSIFSTMTTGQLQSSTLSSACSTWTNFTECANTTACTFDDIYRRTLPYSPSYAKIFNQLIQSYVAVCNTNDISCYSSASVKAALQRCSAIVSVKQTYPFNYDLCTILRDKISCISAAIRGTCDRNTVYALTKVIQSYDEVWRDSYCSLDIDVLVNANLSAKACNSDSFFYCASQTSLWNYGSTYFHQFISGQATSDKLLYYCRLWGNFSSGCVSETGCTVETILRTQTGTASQQNYMKFAKMAQTFCDNQTYQNDYVNYQPCYNSLAVQSASEQCYVAVSAKNNYPYYFYYYDGCLDLEDRTRCSSTAVRKHCNDSAAYTYATTYISYLKDFAGYDSCAFDLNRILNGRTLIVPNCDDLSFFVCSSQPLVWNFASSSVLNSVLNGQTLPSTARSSCSAWNNFTSCANSSGCSFQDIYKLLSTQTTSYWYYGQQYNNSVTTMQYLCNERQEYLTYQSCVNSTAVQTAFRQCDAGMLAKQNYPFYYSTSSCSYVEDTIRCYSSAVRKHCNAATAYAYTEANILYHRTWGGYSSCLIDVNVILNSSSTSVSNCDPVTFFYCSSQMNWNYASGSTIAKLYKAQIAPNEIGYYCRVWSNFSSCINSTGCTFDGMYQWLTTRPDFYWSYQQIYNNTVVSFTTMCKDIINVYEGEYACYNSTAVQNGMKRCEGILQTKKSYPFFLSYTCSLARSELRCYAATVNTFCNQAAARSIASIFEFYQQRWNGLSSCYFDMNALLNTSYTALTCDDDAFYACSKESGAWTHATSNALSLFSTGRLTRSGIACICGTWDNFTTCANSSGCTFTNVYQLLTTQSDQYWSSTYRKQYNNSISSMRYICDRTQEYMDYQSCLASQAVVTSFRRCDAILGAKSTYPFYQDINSCTSVASLIRCYYNAVSQQCNTSVADNVVAHNLYNRQLWREQNCTTEFNSSSVLAVVRCDEYYYCHSTWNVLASITSGVFSSWSKAELDYTTFATYCGLWRNFSACANSSGCTSDDIAAQQTSYPYFSNAFRSISYMCDSVQDYAVHRQCYVRGRAAECDNAQYLQNNHPYYNFFPNYCTNVWNSIACVLNATTAACNRVIALRTMQYRIRYFDIWEASCKTDELRILNITVPANATCSLGRYINCLSQLSYLKNYGYFYNNYYMQFSSLSRGSYSWSTLSLYCQEMNRLNRCVGCRADDDKFPTNALGLDRYMYQPNDALTPRRLNGLCAVNSQDYTTFQNCFSARNLYSTFQMCQYRAADLLDTTANDCRYYTYWLRCFYDEASSVCSVSAAKYLTDYMLNALPQYLNYTYGCTIAPSDVYSSCDGPGCMYELSTAVPRYITALQTGRLTANDLAQLCTHTTSAVTCLTTNVRASCPVQPANYDMMSNQVLPFVCDFPNIKRYETYQQCFLTISSSQLIVSRYFDSNATCASSKSSLSSLYTSLSTPCGSGAASAVVTYTSLLRTVRTLANNETDNCTSALYPTTNAIPQFLGPFFVDSNDPNNPYIDFYFICRVNYSLQSTDDGARFDVSLSSNDQPSSTFKTTTSMELNVTFTSKELPKTFYGTEVSCSVRSYWVQVPTVKSVVVFSSSSYFVGIRYWTDISSGGDVTIAESSPLVPIYFQATVPLSCDITLKLFKNAGLFVSECSLTFSASDPPRTSRTLYVRAVPTAGSNTRILKLNFSPVTTLCTGSPWYRYQLSTIPVVVTDSFFSGSCSSDGDPHIRTFDGKFYSVYFAGDFLLWKSYSTTLVEVHVRHQRCAVQTVSCNCAVAFREGNNILGVYACDPNRPPIAIRYLTDPDQPARDVQISSNGLSFTITMPSGRYMTVRTGCAYCQRLAIVIYPISEDISRSTGLCGNYNSIPDDDTVPKGDIFPDKFSEPVLFTRSYMLGKEESLINAHKFLPTCQPKTVVQPRICKCNDLGTGKSDDKCDLSNVNGASSKSAVTFVTYSTDLCSSGARRKREAVSGTSQNVIGIDELPPEDPGTPPDTPLHPDVEASNQTNIDITTARALCQEPLERSAIYRQCSSYTTETKDAIIDSCSLDVQLTGDPESVLNVILARYSEACIRGVQESDTRSLEEAVQLYNETSDDNDTESDTGSSIAPAIISPEILAVLETLAQQMCPGQPTECSGNGTCQNSTCICFPGRIGVDCSLSDDVAPRITDLRYGATCIVREGQPCSSVSLFVRDVVYSENFTCKVICSGQTYYTSYQPASGGEVHCQLPVSPGDAQSTNPSYKWSVSVSNNNRTFSNAVELFVYDSKCVDCNNVTFVCEQKNGTCLIDGKCYVRDELSPIDPCLRCDPRLNSTAWKQDPPSACATTSRPQTTTNAPIRDTTVGMTGLPISSARTIAFTNAQSTISAVAGVSSLPSTAVPAFSTSAIVQGVTSLPRSSMPAGGVTSLPSTAAQSPGMTTAPRTAAPATVVTSQSPMSASGAGVTSVAGTPTGARVTDAPGVDVSSTAGGPSTANPAAAASSSSLRSAGGTTAPTTPAAGSQTAPAGASASSTKGQEVTTAGNVYGTWGEWSSCTSGCTNRTSSRTRTCRAGSSCRTAQATEIRTCLTQECPESADEKPQGVILITKLDFSKKIKDPAELSDFISEVDNVINVFCNANRGRKFYCCKYRYQSSDTTLPDPDPDSAAIDFVTEGLTSVGNGFPRELGSTAEVKLLFRALRPGLDRQCSAGSSASRRKRQSNSDIAYLNKTLMAEALNTNIASSNLSDIQSASPAPDAAPTKEQSSTDVVKIVVPVVVGGVVAIVLVFCALRFIRRSKSRSKDVDAPVVRQANRFGPERVFAVRPLRTYYQPQYRYRNSVYVQ